MNVHKTRGSNLYNVIYLMLRNLNNFIYMACKYKYLQHRVKSQLECSMSRIFHLVIQMSRIGYFTVCIWFYVNERLYV